MRERDSMLKTIFTLAWPTMLEEFMQTAVQYIDTAMVGTLGTLATAAVGATGTVNWLVGGLASSLGVGFLAYIAQSCGAGDQDKAAKASGQAVLTTIVVGITLTILCLSLSSKVPVWMQVDESIQEMASRYFFILYTPMIFRSASIIFGMVLRASGDTRTPMKVGVVVNITNVILNFLLIYPTRQLGGLTIPGAGMGIEGAALASAIAYSVGGILVTIALYNHPFVSFRGQPIKPDSSILVPCLKVSLPNFFQRFGTSMGYVVFASMINALGGIATAAHTIANTVESAFYIPGYGMQTAAATLAGNAFGANDEKKLNDLARTIIPLEVGLMIVSGSLLFIFAPNLIRIFTKDPEVIRLGTTVLRMVAVSEPFYGVPIVIEGLMQGTGNTMPPFVYNILGMWGVRILGTFICTVILHHGLVSAWACMIGHNLMLFVVFGIHFMSGKWHGKLKAVND